MKEFVKSTNISDRTNSVRALTDASGAEVVTYDYDAYGKTWNLKPETLNSLGFTSRPLDPETGLIYMRNRYYSPKLGRFISRDPLGYKNTFYSASTLIDPITVSYHDGANAASQPGFPYNLAVSSGVNTNPSPGPIYIGAYLTKQNTYAMQDMGLYHYALSNPMAYFDPLGLWSLNFTFDANRDNTGTWAFYDDNGNLMGGGDKTLALGRGSDTYEYANDKGEIKEGLWGSGSTKKYDGFKRGGKIRSHKEWKSRNGDTPTGVYKYSDGGISSRTKTFGTEKRILLDPVAGNAAKTKGRSGIMVHAGEPSKDGSRNGLRPTQGCVRLSADDMKAINGLIEAYKDDKRQYT